MPGNCNDIAFTCYKINDAMLCKLEQMPAREHSFMNAEGRKRGSLSRLGIEPAQPLLGVPDCISLANRMTEAVHNNIKTLEGMGETVACINAHIIVHRSEEQSSQETRANEQTVMSDPACTHPHRLSGRHLSGDRKRERHKQIKLQGIR